VRGPIPISCRVVCHVSARGAPSKRGMVKPGRGSATPPQGTTYRAKAPQPIGASEIEAAFEQHVEAAKASQAAEAASSTGAEAQQQQTQQRLKLGPWDSGDSSNIFFGAFVKEDSSSSAKAPSTAGIWGGAPAPTSVAATTAPPQTAKTTPSPVVGPKAAEVSCC
jgi:hypothetical protein